METDLLKMAVATTSTERWVEGVNSMGERRGWFNCFEGVDRDVFDTPPHITFVKYLQPVLLHFIPDFYPHEVKYVFSTVEKRQLKLHGLVFHDEVGEPLFMLAHTNVNISALGASRTTSPRLIVRSREDVAEADQNRALLSAFQGGMTWLLDRVAMVGYKAGHLTEEVAHYPDQTLLIATNPTDAICLIVRADYKIVHDVVGKLISRPFPF